MEALDRTLRDLPCVNRPFGGKTILLCGDWRQTGQIVPFGADADVVQASLLSSPFLLSSPLWGKLQRRHLALPQRDQGDLAHAQFVGQVGENRVPTSIVHGTKTIWLAQTIDNADGGATYCIDHVNDIGEPIAFMYPDLACDARMCEKRIAMTNAGIDDINDSILQRLPGRMHTFFSRDTIQEGSDLYIYIIPEQIHDVNILGLPLHELHLNVGAMVMFIHCLVQPQRILDSIAYVANFVLPALLSPTIRATRGISTLSS